MLGVGARAGQKRGVYWCAVLDERGDGWLIVKLIAR